MTGQEIQELLKLRGWSPTDLASKLGMSESGVNRWIHESRTPKGAATILMRQWLNESRANGKSNGRKAVKA